jgi:hypothetical protein
MGPIVFGPGRNPSERAMFTLLVGMTQLVSGFAIMIYASPQADPGAERIWRVAGTKVVGGLLMLIGLAMVGSAVRRLWADARRRGAGGKDPVFRTAVETGAGELAERQSGITVRERLKLMADYDCFPIWVTRQPRRAALARITARRQ